MAALKWGTRLRRRLEDVARLSFGGGFRYRGVTFQHPGVLFDQERAAEVVDRVVDTLTKRAHRSRAVVSLLDRVDVRVLPSRDAEIARVDVDARWAGGFRDRGCILMRRGDDWPDRLGRALLALLLLELEPQTAPKDVPLNVVEEAADG